MEFANNVSYDLRDALDTIVRKRNKSKKGGKPKKAEGTPKKKWFRKLIDPSRYIDTSY